MRDTSSISTSDIADAAGQPEHRAWNLLLLLAPKYRPTSRTGLDADDFGGAGQEPMLPQSHHYYYDGETADSAIAELAEIAAKLGDSADAFYSVDDLGEALGSGTFTVKERLNVGWKNRSAECAWPVTLAPDGEPFFDGVVLEILRRREGR